MLSLWFANLPDMFVEGNKNTELGHSLSSLLKAYGSWESQEIVHESKEACGSNGYLQTAIFGIIDQINDLNQTWEGDNNVLLLQVQAFLLKCLKYKMNEEQLPETLEFLTDEMPDLIQFDGDVENIDSLLKVFANRANYMVHK